VIFLPLNLANGNYPALENFTVNMDLIVCRNVTIYFDQTVLGAIVGRFYQCLNEMGSLLVGHSELSMTTYHQLAPRSYKKIMYYQKVTGPGEPLPVMAAPQPETARPALQPPAPQQQVMGLEAAWSRAKDAADREKWDEALAFLMQVESPHMFRPEFHYLHGLVHMAAENVDKALWAWRQALYCDPMFALAHYSLGELYEQRGEHKIATRYWNKALAAIAGLEPEHRLLFSEDITVEMLQGLLAYRVSKTRE
jgi:chemotaxis protein methyltransferase CheR